MPVDVAVLPLYAALSACFTLLYFVEYVTGRPCLITAAYATAGCRGMPRHLMMPLRCCHAVTLLLFILAADSLRYATLPYAPPLCRVSCLLRCCCATPDDAADDGHY